MRPHLLELEAFGAFPGCVTLDLDSLGNGGLLLLCGRTGSGKTTLLDAIGFALYGVVPGVRSKAKDLRSHHAADGVAPWVQLEFTARGRRFRVRRSPAWQRAGRAKDVAASGQLWEASGGSWVARSTRLDEIGHELSTVLGMTAEQFHQVVVLPQGRFADFLQASSKERETLLNQLFAVDRFRHVQEWLRSRAAAAEQHLQTASAEAGKLAERVAQADGSGLPDGIAAEVWAATLLTSALRDADRLSSELRDADLARADADAALLYARDLAGRQRRRIAAEHELAGIRAAGPAAALSRGRLAAGRQALPVCLAAQGAEAARAAASSASASAAAHDDVLAAAGISSWSPICDRDPAELTSAAAAAQARVGELTALGELHASTAAAVAEHSEADAMARTLDRQVDVLAEVVDVTGPARVEQARGELAEVRARLVTLPVLERETADVAAGQLILADRGNAEVTAVEAAGSLAVAVAAAKRARSSERDIRNRRIDAAATELAALLEDDTPCPVCGSLDHPEIAELRDGDATREQETAAADRVADALDRLAQCTGEEAAARERLARLTAAAASVPPSRPTLASELMAVRRLVSLEPAAIEALEAAQRALAEAREAIVGARHDSGAQRSRAAAALLRAAAGRDRLTLALGAASYATVAEDARRAADLLGRAAELGALVARAHQAERQATAALTRLSRAQGFANVSEAMAAFCETGDLEALELSVAAHDHAVAGVTARLADPDLAVAVEPPADLAAAELQCETTRKTADRLRADAALTRLRADQLAALTPELAAATARQEPLRARAEHLHELAEVTNGRAPNRLLMPLASFVLAARLEEVAEAASSRLLAMSGGRYTLVHNEVGGDRRSRAGLDLAVDDAWTGRRRDTATLSGGETFMAALALALGLTDVVTAETGGASIDALFVDEGFGSLDPDSLDAVMDVLDSLRSGGRLVGVVSHVAEMRQRIPTQVLVDRGTAGSSVRTVKG